MGKKSRQAIATPPTAGAPPRASFAPVLDPHAWTEKDRRYWVAVGVVLALGLFLRLFQLEGPAFQHDEAIYSIFSVNFATYNFDPIYHGPALYYIVHWFFSLFGDSDVVARMVSVVMGIVTFGLVIGPVRRWLGPRAALFALALYAISPSMVTYQRRILFDAFVVVLTLGAVLLFQKIRVERLGSWSWMGAWVALVALLTTFLATKANAFFVIAMLFSFWVMDRLRGVGPRDWLVRMPTQVPIIMFAVVTLAAVFCIRHPQPGAVPRDDDKSRTTRNERALTGVGVVSSAFLWEWLRRSSAARAAKKSGPVDPAAAPPAERLGPPWGRIALCAGASAFAGAFVFAFLFGHGHMWLSAPWETIRTVYINDIFQAMPRMLKYWMGQQAEPRLPGRHDFYLPLLIIYELPILVAFIGGVVQASRNRTPFTDLLLWWSFTSWTLYAMANEKVPWLLMHLVAPFALLAGWWLAQLRLRGTATLVFKGAAVLAVAFLLRNVVATNYQPAVDNREPMFYAFTPDSFKEILFAALDEAKNKPGSIWIYNAWPPSWYMRPTGKGAEFPNVAIHYPEHDAPAEALRLVVCTEGDWDGKYKERFAGWRKWTYVPGEGPMMDVATPNPHILNWPRASWFSLRPDLFLSWFLFRKADIPANPPSQDLFKNEAFLTEWSHVPVVVATPP